MLIHVSRITKTTATDEFEWSSLLLGNSSDVVSDRHSYAGFSLERGGSGSIVRLPVARGTAVPRPLDSAALRAPAEGTGERRAWEGALPGASRPYRHGRVWENKRNSQYDTGTSATRTNISTAVRPDVVHGG